MANRHYVIRVAIWKPLGFLPWKVAALYPLPYIAPSVVVLIVVVLRPRFFRHEQGTTRLPPFPGTALGNNPPPRIKDYHEHKDDPYAAECRSGLRPGC
jgi:hypothetical protein